MSAPPNQAIHPPAIQSQTQTITEPPAASTSSAEPSTSINVNVVGTLKLRGRSSKKAKVQWDEEVIDNEFMGKKKSKSKYSS